MLQKDLRRRVKELARQVGFDAAGVCDLRPIERTALQEWLARGFAGEMAYMKRQAEKRIDPRQIVRAAKRAVVVIKNYYQGASRRWELAPYVGRYAWGEDYHSVVGEKLGRLTGALVDLGASQEHTRWFIDAGPVPERELAVRAGVGWVGKNTMLINRSLGSFTFIGTVLTDLEIPVDAEFSADHCGSCRLCLEACPTAALIEERWLDARRCISYLTIEYRGEFAAGQGELIGEWLFGCDICQDVCPWNKKFAVETDELRFFPRMEVVSSRLEQLCEIDRVAFDQAYSKTALARIGAKGLRRNARQVLANRLGRPSSVKAP